MQNGHAIMDLIGKGRKPRRVAFPNNLAHSLKSYAFDKKLKPEDKLFDMHRTRAWKIIKAAAKKAGINKPVYPHLLRHSDAIERLRQTGNPKALQIHLGHKSPLMTMMYLSTLTAEAALRIQQEVEF
jgi:integrase/recombinase XerD